MKNLLFCFWIFTTNQNMGALKGAPFLLSFLFLVKDSTAWFFLSPIVTLSR